MTDEEFQEPLERICSARSWTSVGHDGIFIRWRCDACGQEVIDNLTLSGDLLFGAHWKPEEPRERVPDAFYRAFE